MPKKRVSKNGEISNKDLASLITGVEKSLRVDIKALDVKLETRFDELGLMIKQGFDDTPTRDEMNQRFNLVDKRFDSVERRLSKLEQNNSIIEKVKEALA
jgi:hypothetical protein